MTPKNGFFLLALTTHFLCALPQDGVAGETWLSALPAEAQASLMWKSDVESGNLEDFERTKWRHPGAGIFNTGEPEVFARATRQAAHSGTWAIDTTISGAVEGRYGKRAVRLMLWTDRAWDDHGDYLPNNAYFSCWLMAPHRYNPQRATGGGWWNVFQFKSEDSTGESQPTWVINIDAQGENSLGFYLFSPLNEPQVVEQVNPLPFAPGEWVHLEAHLKTAPGKSGSIEVIQNGVSILKAEQVVTSLGGKTGEDFHPIWGVGNYTDHISGDPQAKGRATLFFDDLAVSRRALGPYVAKPQAAGLLEPARGW